MKAFYFLFVILSFWMITVSSENCREFERELDLLSSEYPPACGIVHSSFNDMWDGVINQSLTYISQSGNGSYGFCIASHTGPCLLYHICAGTKTSDVYDLVEFDTLFHIFSLRKTFEGASMAHLVSEERLSFEDKISTPYPAYGTHGKENITFGEFMQMKAGVPQFPIRIELEQTANFTFMREFLPTFVPLWPVNGTVGYHAFSYGPHVNEFMLNTVGKTSDEVINEKILARTSNPNFEFYTTLPDDISVQSRVAEIRNTSALDAGYPILCGIPELEGLCRIWAPYTNAPSLSSLNNFTLFMNSYPSYTALSTADTVSAFYGVASDNKALKKSKMFEQEVWDDILANPAFGIDFVRATVFEFVNVSYTKPMNNPFEFIPALTVLNGVNVETYGFTGAGGQMGIGMRMEYEGCNNDRDQRGFGFAILKNQLQLYPYTESSTLTELARFKATQFYAERCGCSDRRTETMARPEVRKGRKMNPFNLDSSYFI